MNRFVDTIICIEPMPKTCRDCPCFYESTMYNSLIKRFPNCTQGVALVEEKDGIGIKKNGECPLDSLVGHDVKMYEASFKKDAQKSKEILKEKKRADTAELALGLAIDLEPISCQEVCGHDNNNCCLEDNFSKCHDKHKERLLKMARFVFKQTKKTKGEKSE